MGIEQSAHNKPQQYRIKMIRQKPREEVGEKVRWRFYGYAAFQLIYSLCSKKEYLKTNKSSNRDKSVMFKDIKVKTEENNIFN